jgi:hypothetical protein
VLRVKSATNRPYAVNFLLAFDPVALPIALDAGAPIIQFAWGIPTQENATTIRSAGAKMGIQISSVAGARRALDVSADYLICQERRPAAQAKGRERYAPNGNPQPGPKFTSKLAWLKRLAAHAADLYATGVPVVLAGDYNVVPADRDIYPTKSWDNDALLQPESRVEYARLLAQGWVDAIRALHPNKPMYTFWDYKRQRWERDAGLRLDQILLSPSLAGRLRDAGVDRAVRGKDEASDHAPVWVELHDVPAARRRSPRKSEGAAGNVANKASHTSARITKASKTSRRGPSKQRQAPIVREGPLLIIDGDSFAHRAYHAPPKTILRGDGKGAGAIVGFANFLLRVYLEEQPRAVVVGWDTLDVPTERHKQFPAYQAGRHPRLPFRGLLKLSPTLHNWEGRADREAIDKCTCSIHRGSGHSTPRR